MNVWLHALVRTEDGRDATAHLREDALARIGVSVDGVWSGATGFGLRSDEAVVLLRCSDDASAGAAVEALRAPTDVVEVQGTPLHELAAPEPPQAPDRDAGGFWVFRHFDVAADDLPRFRELSVSAWPTFQTATGARVERLFRGPERPDGSLLVLLLTWYPDLATWEGSRAPEADPEGHARFAERRALTRHTRAVALRAVAT